MSGALQLREETSSTVISVIHPKTGERLWLLPELAEGGIWNGPLTNEDRQWIADHLNAQPLVEFAQMC